MSNVPRLPLTDDQLIELVERTDPDELSLEELEQLRDRLKESAPLRASLLERLMMEQYLCGALARINVTLPDIVGTPAPSTRRFRGGRAVAGRGRGRVGSRSINKTGAADGLGHSPRDAEKNDLGRIHCEEQDVFLGLVSPQGAALAKDSFHKIIRCPGGGRKGKVRTGRQGPSSSETGGAIVRAAAAVVGNRRHDGAGRYAGSE
jgi:hypothetical protein